MKKNVPVFDVPEDEIDKHTTTKSDAEKGTNKRSHYRYRNTKYDLIKKLKVELKYVFKTEEYND